MVLSNLFSSSNHSNSPASIITSDAEDGLSLDNNIIILPEQTRMFHHQLLARTLAIGKWYDLNQRSPDLKSAACNQSTTL